MQDVVVPYPRAGFHRPARGARLRPVRPARGRRRVCDLSLPDAAGNGARLLLLARPRDRRADAPIRVVRDEDPGSPRSATPASSTSSRSCCRASASRRSSARGRPSCTAASSPGSPSSTPSSTSSITSIPPPPASARFANADGTRARGTHAPEFYDDVAAMTQQYLASNPDPALYEFLRWDFAELQRRYGGVTATTFRNFPSFPQRYMEPCSTLPVEDVSGRQGRAAEAPGAAGALHRAGPARPAVHRRGRAAAGSEHPSRSNKARRPVRRAQPLDAHLARAARRVHELVPANRRCRRATRPGVTVVKNTRSPGSSCGRIDLPAGAELLGHRPRHADAVLPEHVLHEPAAVEP